ncbi:MAG: helix-turn-helix transcriptional regulator [Myxococcales bacterium]|nr:helix-turn-helix transcriptional regulator [Myxococcales bacterium]
MEAVAQSKYGAPLTTGAWRGCALRAGRFTEHGTVEALVAQKDAVLVWSGGTSEVTLHEHRPAVGSRAQGTHRFARRGGMIDLLPKHTVIDRVSWRGQPSGCISVTLGGACLDRLGAPGSPGLDPERGFRLCVSDAHIVDLVRRLEAQAVQGESWSGLYVEALSLTLATYVLGRYGAAPAEPAGDGERLRSFEVGRLVEYVDSHLDCDISLGDLAEQIGVKANRLGRLFKGSFGVPPHQYVLARRIERAKTMLREGRQSIAEIALSCGFANQSHFSACFKARSGVTPNTFRRG